MRVDVVRGREALHELGDAFDDLLDAVAAPVTARRPWLQAWVESYRAFEPVVVVARGPLGRLEAAVPLAVRRRRGVRQVVGLGDGPSDASMFPARDPAAAETVAAAAADWLGSLTGPWTLVVRHLVAEDLVAPRLRDRLGRAALDAGDVSPQLHAAEDAQLSDHVSSRHGQEVRRRLRKLDRDGLAPVVAHVVDPAGIRALMPEVERVFRARDEELGRRCALDDPSAGAFFRGVLDDYAERGELCLTTLTTGGELAAYVQCFVDGSTYRMWNCRFDPRFARYSTGMVAMDASVAHALEAGCRVYDFMRGDERYKESYANHRARVSDLRAWSGPVLEARHRLWTRARGAAERWETRGGRSARMVALARRAAERVVSR